MELICEEYVEIYSTKKKVERNELKDIPVVEPEIFEE